MSQKAKLCGSIKCRSYRMPVGEFCALTGEDLDHSFKVKLGLKARELYRDIYDKEQPKRRSGKTYRNKHRNEISIYPCGILEQAYKRLRAETAPTGEDAKQPR